jgi:hypothetical protein
MKVIEQTYVGLTMPNELNIAQTPMHKVCMLTRTTNNKLVFEKQILSLNCYDCVIKLGFYIS